MENMGLEVLEIYKGKKVLITGHTGFKGAWLSQWLLKAGAEVAGYSVNIPSQPSLFESLKLKDHLIHHVGDVEDYGAFLAFIKKFNPDFVFHLAAQAYVRLSYDQPQRTFATNVMGTVNVLEAIRHTPSVRAGVIVTTDKCYLNLETGRDFLEDDKLGGHDPYSASKAAAEIAFSAYWKSFFGGANSKMSPCRLASARAGNVIGGGDWSLDRLVPDCVAQWSKGQEVVLRSPHSVRPWQHVLDSLFGYITLASKLITEPHLNGESFNFGPEAGSKKTVLELVSELQKTWPKAKYKIDSATIGAKKESQVLFLNFDKARNKLGWQPRWNFQKTVERTASWYAQYYESPSQTRALVERELNTFESS